MYISVEIRFSSHTTTPKAFRIGSHPLTSEAATPDARSHPLLCLWEICASPECLARVRCNRSRYGLHPVGHATVQTPGGWEASRKPSRLSETATSRRDFFAPFSALKAERPSQRDVHKMSPHPRSAWTPTPICRNLDPHSQIFENPAEVE
ncbi:hypothetical protein FA13DRAFT_1526845 [Coprinellus micaceus]|uniref:Uncharacterized protein n=1 Tax=Coprinellus micaceus TaxID=71717 RepID=A0A4Y7SJB0_COPMI|nr:hypothetical protein FA13DRAFT_1526845 [Coprinellus micaceus]